MYVYIYMITEVKLDSELTKLYYYEGQSEVGKLVRLDLAVSLVLTVQPPDAAFSHLLINCPLCLIGY